MWSLCFFLEGAFDRGVGVVYCTRVGAAAGVELSAAEGRSTADQTQLSPAGQSAAQHTHHNTGGSDTG